MCVLDAQFLPRPLLRGHRHLDLHFQRELEQPNCRTAALGNIGHAGTLQLHCNAWPERSGACSAVRGKRSNNSPAAEDLELGSRRFALGCAAAVSMEADAVRSCGTFSSRSARGLCRAT